MPLKEGETPRCVLGFSCIRHPPKLQFTYVQGVNRGVTMRSQPHLGLLQS